MTGVRQQTLLFVESVGRQRNAFMGKTEKHKGKKKIKGKEGVEGKEGRREGRNGRADGWRKEKK